MIAIETIGPAVPEKPMVEPSPESASLETPRKDERPPEPRTPLYTPPPKPASTTPIVEPPPTMIEKAREANEGSLPEKKPVSSEESFVEVTLEEGEINEAGPEEVKEDAENEGYLSGSLGPSDSEGSIDGTDEEDEDEDEEEVPINGDEDTETPSRATSMDPTTVPLPVSRSPSVAPEVPSIVISTDPTQKSLPVQETSTTPSGTPAKPETAAFAKPASTTPLGQPSGIGLGRPNTRPTRSSPLAGAPVIGQDRVESAKKDVEELKTEVVELKVPPSSKPSADFYAKAASDGEMKTPTPQTPPSSAATSSSTLKPAPIPGVPPKLSSASATSPFLVHKAEPQRSKSMFGGMTGLFGGTSSQSGLAGSPPTTESQVAPSKLPFSLKADGGTPSSAALFGASLARPVSSPLTLATAAPSFSGLNRPASVPPSNFFTKPPTGTAPTGSQFGVKGPAGGSSFFGKPSMPGSAKTSPPEVPLEEGIQKECALLYNTMNQELEEVRLVVIEDGVRNLTSVL